MLRVGLTGGIGSGKSTVAHQFGARGVPIIDTDQIAHAMVQPGTAALADIIKQYGDGVLDTRGALNRDKLRTLVFNDSEERKRLETILHPRIRAEVKRQLDGLDAPYVIVAVPLLIETGFDDLVDRILVVDADETLQIERTTRRSGIAAQEIQKIISAQAAREQRLARADDVIDNNGDLVALERQVTQLHQRYLSLA